MKFEGFDFAKAAEPGQVGQVRLCRRSAHVGTMPASEADAETWFNIEIKGEMEKLGHKIDWVKGDRFQFTNWQGTFVVDYLRGAASATRRWPGRSSSSARARGAIAWNRASTDRRLQRLFDDHELRLEQREQRGRLADALRAGCVRACRRPPACRARRRCPTPLQAVRGALEQRQITRLNGLGELFSFGGVCSRKSATSSATTCG